jgi:hypothetical protein
VISQQFQQNEHNHPHNNSININTQQNEHNHPHNNSININTHKKTWSMTFEIQVMVWDRYTQLIGSQPWPLLITGVSS